MALKILKLNFFFKIKILNNLWCGSLCSLHVNEALGRGFTFAAQFTRTFNLALGQFFPLLVFKRAKVYSKNKTETGTGNLSLMLPKMPDWVRKWTKVTIDRRLNKNNNTKHKQEIQKNALMI